MMLEMEKRRIEDQLEGERALGLDKDTLLERTKRRESELEVASLQADLETLDSQLDHTQKESEDKVGDIIFLLISTDKMAHKDLVKDRSVSLEQDARHSKEQNQQNAVSLNSSLLIRRLSLSNYKTTP